MSDSCRDDHDAGGSLSAGWFAVALTLSALLLGTGLVLEFLRQQPRLAGVAYAVAALLAGPKTFRGAWRALRRRRLGMSFLMTLAAAGAFATGNGEEGAAVLLLFAVAEELEDYAEERAHSSISRLIELAPETARVRRGGGEVEVATDDVEPGEILVLRPGDKVALDGIVRDGASSVDEAAITGESVPVDKEPGDRVFAASLVNEGFLEVEVTAAADRTVLARIVELVEAAEQRKARTERFVDRFAGIYTPAVVLTAAAVATVPPLLFGQAFGEWLYRGLVLLVVSCPCALAISTPVSFVSAITSAARHGVLIKGSAFIERIRGARVVAFDKTGTLTEGRLTVDAVTALEPVPAGSEGAATALLAENRREGPTRKPADADAAAALRIAAGIESRSKHPIARALVERAEERGLEIAPPDAFESVAGRGVIARRGGTRYLLGSAAFLREQGVEVPDAIAGGASERGRTVVFLAAGSRALASFALVDRIRGGAREAVAGLRAAGIHTVMLTGDGRATAEAVGTELGIDEVRAELLPEDKVVAVERLSEERGAVVAVGDGVNDAPALAAASVGIAMGVAGSDVALETADVALMRDDLEKLPYLFDLSRRTLAVVRQNIVVSIGVKGTLGLLALPGMVSLWVAVAVGDMGLSLAVILNALRIGIGGDLDRG